MNALIFLLLAPLAAAAPTFRPATQITDGSAVAHLSRSTKGQLAWADNGRLALIYAENPTGQTIQTTGKIMVREWTNRDGWSGAAQLNAESTAGAFQPTLVRRPDGSLFAAWQDYRHCTPANMMDNIEIYGALRPAGGVWSANVRITQTAAGGNGDNGYLPKLAVLGDGRVAAAWFDFFWGDTVDPVWGWPASEVAVKISDAGAEFNPAMSGATRTVAADRAADEEGVSFTAPDVAVDGSGNLNVVWASGIANPEGSNLYYGVIDPNTGVWIYKGRIRQGAGGQYDPAKILTHGADVWVLYTDGAAYGNPEVMLQMLQHGAAAPVRLTNDPGEQHYADAAIDGDGKIHCVLINGPVANNKLQYVLYDPAAGAVTERVDLNYGCIGDDASLFSRPAIAVDGGGVYLVWSSGGTLRFTTTAAEPAPDAAGEWRNYE